MEAINYEDLLKVQERHPASFNLSNRAGIFLEKTRVFLKDKERRYSQATVLAFAKKVQKLDDTTSSNIASVAARFQGVKAQLLIGLRYYSQQRHEQKVALTRELEDLPPDLIHVVSKMLSKMELPNDIKPLLQLLQDSPTEESSTDSLVEKSTADSRSLKRKKFSQEALPRYKDTAEIHNLVKPIYPVTVEDLTEFLLRRIGETNCLVTKLGTSLESSVRVDLAMNGIILIFDEPINLASLVDLPQTAQNLQFWLSFKRVCKYIQDIEKPETMWQILYRSGFAIVNMPQVRGHITLTMRRYFDLTEDITLKKAE